MISEPKLFCYGSSSLSSFNNNGGVVGEGVNNLSSLNGSNLFNSYRISSLSLVSVFSLVAARDHAQTGDNSERKE